MLGNWHKRHRVSISLFIEGCTMCPAATSFRVTEVKGYTRIQSAGMLCTHIRERSGQFSKGR